MDRLTLGTARERALKLRCPRCGGGKLFKGWFAMYESCPSCKLKYERAPGYFLGSTYVNYGMTAALTTGAYVALHFGFGYSNQAIAAPLIAFVIIFPMLFFRHARALWLAMDLVFDPDGNEQGKGG